MKTFLITAIVALFALTTAATAHPNHGCHWHDTYMHCR